MSFVIIDKKKVDLTTDEYNTYKKIITSYTIQPYQKGEDFFIDLFEVDEDGIIIFLKPPSQRQVSLEIFLFVMSIMAHQHMRRNQDQVNAACKKMNEVLAQKLAELDSKMVELNNKIAELNK